MTCEFDRYKAAIIQGIRTKGATTAADQFEATRKWYQASGRAGFIAFFQHETGGRLNESRADAQRVELGLPKSPSDGNAKVKDTGFYCAHGEWFLQEVDRILAADANYQRPKSEPYFSSLNEILGKLLIDSMMLMEDFAQWHQGVPGVFDVGKNRREHNVALFHAGWQAIYGTYSPLSASDNHADTAISHLRMNIELRLRYGFGVLGLTDTRDGGFGPLGLSKLIAGVSQHQADIILGRPISHIDRIYSWTNLYIHGGFKLYTWCAPATLGYLAPFLVGGKYSTAAESGFSVFAGIQATAATILAVQQTVLSSVQGEMKDPTRYTLESISPDQCELILTGPVPPMLPAPGLLPLPSMTIRTGLSGSSKS